MTEFDRCATADLYDENSDAVEVMEPMFNSYGRRRAFFGAAVTLKLFEDNSLVRETLSEKGAGRVLVIDGGGSRRCALVGDKIADLASENGWAGIICYGCIRDSAVIADIDIGIKALNTNPRKSIKQGRGDRDIAVQFAGVSIRPGDYVYADPDGVLVAREPLVLP